MLDILYMSITAGFFALMLAYTRACERLGRRGAEPKNKP
jgi:hypothetical protein